MWLKKKQSNTNNTCLKSNKLHILPSTYIFAKMAPGTSLPQHKWACEGEQKSPWFSALGFEKANTK